MRKALMIFVIGALVVWGITMAVQLSFGKQLGQMAGLLALPMAVTPLIMAYIAHKSSGAAGNPFKGLVWGGTASLMLAWLSGLLIGCITVGLILGLGFAQLDTSLESYVDLIAEQSAAQGNPIPAEGMGVLAITGWSTLGAGITVGPWFGAFFGCLGTLPWLGWFGRRMLVWGKPQALTALVSLSLVLGTLGGAIDNPYQTEVSMPVRLALAGLGAAAGTLSSFWIFLKTRSAFVPALFQASVQGALLSGFVLLGEINQLMVSLVGVVVSALVGIALWVWKDPGGAELAVAAVAIDGTPLTPAQVAAAQAVPAAVAG